MNKIIEDFLYWCSENPFKTFVSAVLLLTLLFKYLNN